MAGFTDTLRGDGLARAQRALVRLEGDSLRLDRERWRFSDSPPPYTSDPSGTTTRSKSPVPLSEEQRRRQQRRVQLGLERDASKPYYQFEAQTSEEEKRLWEADRNRTRRIRVGENPSRTASEIVKNCWVEQGIRNNNWNTFAFGRWKHEEPLEVESESETDSEAPTPLFSLPQPKPRRPKSDKEKRQIAEQRLAREREHEASRPYFQFVYQISKERERSQDETRSEESATAADINSRAYESIKATWIKRGIWNRKWGILPGMSWKHEEPLQEEIDDGPVSALVDLRGNAQLPVGHEGVEAPPRPIFGSPSPVEPIQPRESGIANVSQQKPPGNIDLVGLENGNAEHTPSASNLRHTGNDGQAHCPIIGQTSRRRNRKPSQKAQPVVNESLGPVHSSKVFKAARKTRLGPQRQPNASKKVFFGGLPLFSDVETEEPQPLPVQGPRRSNRIQPLVSIVAPDQTRMASTNPPKPAIRSKSEVNVAKTRTTRSSAKPQGISKRQPAKTARGKARKE